MAKKQEVDTAAELQVTPTVQEPQMATEVATGPVPGTVFIENLMPMEFGTTLTDGTHLHCGPKAGLNKTRVIPKKLLPAHVKRLAQAGKIRIVDAAQGGN